MYLEGKVLELMAMQLAQLITNCDRQATSLTLKPKEIDCIHDARTILLRNLDNSPNIKTLAKTVGIGDRKSPSLERLAQLQPDLILGEEWNNKDEYSLLTQIAPTLLFSDTKNPNELQSWQQDIQGIAKALGKQAQAEKLLKTFDEQIDRARKALQPVLQKYSRVFLISSNLTTQIYS